MDIYIQWIIENRYHNNNTITQLLQLALVLTETAATGLNSSLLKPLSTPTVGGVFYVSPQGNSFIFFYILSFFFSYINLFFISRWSEISSFKNIAVCVQQFPPKIIDLLSLPKYFPDVFSPQTLNIFKDPKRKTPFHQ